MNYNASPLDFESYLQTESTQNEIFFPHPHCGPDVVIKHGWIVYLVQVKFVDTISKQERLNACNTTNPEFFYWNKSKNSPRACYKAVRQFLIDLLKTFEIKRMVFLHTNTNATAGIEEGVELIKQSTNPNFFDRLNSGLWGQLNDFRSKFEANKKRKWH